MSIFCPVYFRAYQRKEGKFLLIPGKVFHNPTGISTEYQDILHLHNLSHEDVMIELFRINGGKTGYYLADLRSKKYYYCGSQIAGVRSQLLKLGIGREHPQGM